MFSEVLHQEAIDLSQDPSSSDQNIFYMGKEALSLEGAETPLIQSALTGDFSAFNQLVEMYQDSLYWWAFSLVKDEAVAEDIAQSTFIAAYEKLKTFRGGSFKIWLFTIARNRSYDELRRKKHHPSLSLEEPSENDRNPLELLSERFPIPEEALIRTEKVATIEYLLNRLPDTFQQVLRLIDMEGLDYQEAADILGLPLETIKSRLTRARLMMHNLFQEANCL